MKAEKLIDRFRQFRALSDRLLITTYWYPLAVGGAWFFIIAALVKHIVIR